MSKLETVLAARVRELSSKVARVGWFEGARYTDDGQDIAVAEVAMIHEYGAPGANIPPRPFFAPTIAENKELWESKLASGIRAVLAGKISADDMHEQVGALAAGQVRKTIGEIREPALAASTVAQRTRDGYTDQPLNRTGHMITTLTNVVAERDQ